MLPHIRARFLLAAISKIHTRNGPLLFTKHNTARRDIDFDAKFTDTPTPYIFITICHWRDSHYITLSLLAISMMLDAGEMPMLMLRVPTL